MKFHDEISCEISQPFLLKLLWPLKFHEICSWNFPHPGVWNDMWDSWGVQGQGNALRAGACAHKFDKFHKIQQNSHISQNFTKFHVEISLRFGTAKFLTLSTINFFDICVWMQVFGVPEWLMRAYDQLPFPTPLMEYQPNLSYGISFMGRVSLLFGGTPYECSNTKWG